MAMFGDTLRQARAHKGVTLKEAEQATRINRHHLAALEDENFSALPPPIYQRGIVRNYAVYLDLDPARLLVMFEEAQGNDPQVMPDPINSLQPLNIPGHWAPNFAIIAFAVVLSVIVIAWIYSAFVAPGDADPTATRTVATVTPFANDVALPTEPPPTRTPTATHAAQPAATPPSTSVTNSGDNTALSDSSRPRRAQPTSVPSNTVESGQTQPASSGVIESGGDNRVDQSTTDTNTAGDSQSNAAQATDDQSDGSGAPAAQPQVNTQAPAQPQAPAAQTGQYVTGISVTSSADIYLEVTADGVSVYAGNLPTGQTTQQFVGSTFNVYTTSGANTHFTNACGVTFEMGYETGEATYTLTANAESCKPNQ